MFGSLGGDGVMEGSWRSVGLLCAGRGLATRGEEFVGFQSLAISGFWDRLALRVAIGGRKEGVDDSPPTV